MMSSHYLHNGSPRNRAMWEVTHECDLKIPEPGCSRTVQEASGAVEVSWEANPVTIRRTLQSAARNPGLHGAFSKAASVGAAA
ncbi:hypothetical protein WJX84_010465 [Apatococcus fuscideae]|uniref:Uncharacterized protein n=1 Tax=Apatococcus fuscideae TaxID=2026836 RepID=A0AAW1RVU1_9CHLO